MNNKVKKALGLQVNHGSQSSIVFTQLTEDFMKPVTHEGITKYTTKKILLYNIVHKFACSWIVEFRV